MDFVRLKGEKPGGPLFPKELSERSLLFDGFFREYLLSADCGPSVPEGRHPPPPNTDVKETQCLLSQSEQVVMDGDGGDDGGGDVGDGVDDGDYILREPLAV